LLVDTAPVVTEFRVTAWVVVVDVAPAEERALILVLRRGEAVSLGHINVLLSP